MGGHRSVDLFDRSPSSCALFGTRSGRSGQLRVQCGVERRVEGGVDGRFVRDDVHTVHLDLRGATAIRGRCLVCGQRRDEDRSGQNLGRRARGRRGKTWVADGNRFGKLGERQAQSGRRAIAAHT